MKTAVTDTSIDAYYTEARCGRLGTVRRKIFDYMRGFKCPVTRQDLAERLDLGINVVCGRVKELLDSGAITVVGEVHLPGCNAREILTILDPQLSLLDGKQGDPYTEVRP